MTVNHTEEMLKPAANDLVSRIGLRVGNWIVALLDALALSRRRQRDYALLVAKTDHELRDIGLTREEVDRAFRQNRPFASLYREQ